MKIAGTPANDPVYGPEKRYAAAVLEDIQPWNLVLHWESCVHDLEVSLQSDLEDWAAYLADPRPFLTDLLGDHGSVVEFCRWETQGHDWEDVITAALDNYLGVVKTV